WIDDEESAAAVPVTRYGYVPAEYSPQPRDELGAGRLDRRGVGRYDQLRDGGAVFSQAGGILDQAITQPQVGPVLGGGRPRGRRGEGDAQDDPRHEEPEPHGRRARPQAGTCGTRASAGSAQRALGISGAQPGRSGSWSYG